MTRLDSETWAGTGLGRGLDDFPSRLDSETWLGAGLDGWLENAPTHLESETWPGAGLGGGWDNVTPPPWIRRLCLGLGSASGLGLFRPT